MLAKARRRTPTPPGFPNLVEEILVGTPERPLPSPVVAALASLDDARRCRTVAPPLANVG